MAEELLGVGFDIHGGGNDLIFPHHENEAAQTRAARGAELARIWMHNGMLQMGEEKMAKSRRQHRARCGEVLERWGRDAVVLFFVAGPLPPAARASATTTLGGRAGRACGAIREAARRLEPGGALARRTWQPLVERFFDALADDFNTPRALAALCELGARGQQARAASGDADLREMLDRPRARERCSTRRRRRRARRRRRRSCCAAREAARAARDFAEADRLRDELRRARLGGARLGRRPRARAAP